MTTNKQYPRIDISNLDFDDIKQSLKTYLRSQSKFSDYDFEGSGINVILDLLAANTHFLGFYMNMVANESFLDTAVSRDSVVSLGKMLGYTPRSRKASRAFVNINFRTTRPTVGGNVINFLPTGSTFRAEVNRTSFNFVTTKPYQIFVNSDGEYFCENVEILEGSVRLASFIVNEQISDQSFVIQDENIDIGTIVVRVATSAVDNTGFEFPWKKNTDFSSIGSESRVYFVEETTSRKYAIKFGDGTFGRRPRDGNQIVVQFLSTNGPDANGIGRKDPTTNRAFVSLDFPQSDVSVVSSSSGGSDRESVSSVRFNAPKAFQAQDRAVTSQDYRSIITSEYGDAESVYVWGGEEATPPQFGKVFISIKPKSGTTLSDLEKTQIAGNILRSRNVLGITPEVVDPEFLYLKLRSRVLYDPSKTSLTSNEVSELVATGILAYSDLELEKFDRSLRYSVFLRNIDSLDTGIISNQTTITLEKRLSPVLGVSSSYIINFENSLFHPEEGYKPVIQSTVFEIEDTDDLTSTIDVYLDDDGIGNIRIYKVVNGQKQFINSTAGTVSYETGTLILTNLKVLGFGTGTTDVDGDGSIKITTVPANLDIESRRNTILIVDPEDPEAVSVTAEPYTVITDPANTTLGTPFPYDTP